MESVFNVDTYCRLLTFAVFVLAGFDFSRYVPKPKAQYSLIAFLLTLTAVAYVVTGGGPILVFGFDIYVNEIAMGASTGLVVGTVYRMRPRFKIRS